MTIEREIQYDEVLGAAEVLSQNGSVLECAGFEPTYQILSSYNHLIIPGAGGKIFETDGGFKKTAETIEQVERKFRHRVAALAAHLKTGNPEQDVFNVWHWLKSNIAYKYDTTGVEEIRTPSRSFAERYTGVDCEDLAIFAASLLKLMGYRPKFTYVAFKGRESFGHIYVLCNGMVVDAVLNQFNEHPKYITKSMKIEVLDGVDTQRPLIYGLGAVAPADDITLGLMEQQSKILKAAQTRNLSTDEKKELRKIRFCIMLNELPERDVALDFMPYIDDITEDGGLRFVPDAPLGALEEYLEGLDEDGYFDDDDFDEIDGLGAKKKKKSKAEKKKARKEKRKKRLEKFKKSKFGKALNKAGKAFNRFLNPATIAARNGFLLAMKLNLFKIAGQLKWGYYTEQQAIAKGAKKEKWQKAVTTLKRVENVFEKLGGKAKNLKNAILKGRATKKERERAKKQLKGIYGIDVDALLAGTGLGDGGITAGAAITAATAVITAVVSLIKKGGIKKGDFPDEGEEGRAADASAADLTTVESATEAEVSELEGNEQSPAEDAGFKNEAEAKNAEKVLLSKPLMKNTQGAEKNTEDEDGEKKPNYLLWGALGLGVLGAGYFFLK